MFTQDVQEEFFKVCLFPTGRREIEILTLFFSRVGQTHERPFWLEYI